MFSADASLSSLDSRANRGSHSWIYWNWADENLSLGTWRWFLAFWDTNDSHGLTVRSWNDGSRSNDIDRWLGYGTRWRRRRRCRRRGNGGTDRQRWNVDRQPVSGEELAVGCADGLDRAAGIDLDAINVVLTVNERRRRRADASWNSGRAGPCGRNGALGRVGHASESRLQWWWAKVDGRGLRLADAKLLSTARSRAEERGAGNARLEWNARFGTAEDGRRSLRLVWLQR